MPAIPERRRRPLARSLRSGLLTGFGRLLDLLFSRLSWNRSQRLGRAFGRLGWRLARRDRRRTLDHLAFAYPELAVGERAALAARSFAHLGTLLGECLHLRHLPPAELVRHVTLEGWEHVEAARAARRPIVIVTGHCGNWELLAAALNARGLGMLVVAREIDEPGLQTMLLDLRARFGTRTIVRGTPGAARALLGALRGAGALGMLIDQDTRVEGVFVDFFGRPAWTPVGAAELALRFDAAVLPTFIERRADGSHRAVIHAELTLPTDATAATALMTNCIEAQVRSHPEQWVWLHRRWRRRPEERP
jgi:KDO2-lipid IV(A) lauroyltransferase